MAVPDAVRFANTGTEVLTYGDVRGLDNDKRLFALKKRLDHWLVGQIDPLTRKDEKGEHVVYCPFPLVMLTCVTIETLGSIFFSGGVEKDETRDIFESAAIYMDKGLKGPMEKGFKGKMRNYWTNDQLKTIESASDVIYKFFRNCMLHSYRAKGVFIGVRKDSPPWEYGDGFLVIEPWKFWELVRVNGYEKMFDEALSGKSASMRSSAIVYLEKMLS